MYIHYRDKRQPNKRDRVFRELYGFSGIGVENLWPMAMTYDQRIPQCSSYILSLSRGNNIMFAMATVRLHRPSRIKTFNKTDSCDNG